MLFTRHRPPPLPRSYTPSARGYGSHRGHAPAFEQSGLPSQRHTPLTYAGCVEPSSPTTVGTGVTCRFKHRLNVLRYRYHNVLLCAFERSTCAAMNEGTTPKQEERHFIQHVCNAEISLRHEPLDAARYRRHGQPWEPVFGEPPAKR